MLSNYLIIALRRFVQNKVFSMINVTGLTMTLISAIFITAYFENEISYDQYHKNKNLIYRLTIGFEQADERERFDYTAHGARELLTSQFPEIDHAIRFYPVDGNVVITGLEGSRVFSEENFYYADKEVFEVFTHPMLHGDAGIALDGHYKIVLSKELSLKYFNEETSIGKSVSINGKNYMVTGIIENVPDNSHLYFDALLSTPPEHKDFKPLYFDALTYVLFRPEFDYDAFVEKLAQFDQTIFLPMVKDLFGNDDFKVSHRLDPLTETHFITDLSTDLTVSPKSNIYIFPAVGLLLIIIMCMNTANLSISHGLERNRDIGIRKVVGASKTQILSLFVLESLLAGSISLVLAFTLKQLLQGAFFDLLGKQFPIAVTGGYVLTAIAAIVFVYIFSSTISQYFLIYSKATFLLAQKPNYRDRWSLKNSIMTLQFALSLLVSTGALIVFEQYTFMKDKDLGYQRDQVLVLKLPGIMESKEKASVLKEQLLKLPGVDKVSLGHVPVDAQWVNSYSKQGESNVSLIKGIHGDEDYIELLGLSLLAGGNFSPQVNPDKLEHKQIIINESFARTLGWDDPIGQQIDYGAVGEIIGVVQDYHFQSLHQGISPIVIEYNKKWPWHVLIKRSPGSIEPVENAWYTVYPDKPFDYYFLDDSVAQLYIQEARINQLLWCFSLLIISLTCFGLYGISYYAIIRRTKEIGIRKVLGATLKNLLVLLSKDFIKLIVLAMAIALPLSIILSKKWVMQYAYQIHLDWHLYTIPPILFLVIALTTMSFQTFKTARENPVNALRYE